MSSAQPLSHAQVVRRLCAAAFDVPEVKLMGRCRQRWVSIPRQAACYVLRKRFPLMSYPTIAKLMGGRDHTTIIHAVRKTESRMERDPDFARKITALVGARINWQMHDAHVIHWAAWRAALPKARRAALAFRLCEPPVFDDPDLAESVLPDRVFCKQCDRAVLRAEAARCAARLCAVRPRGTIGFERVSA